MKTHSERELSLVRIYLLRAMYLLISVGLALTVWPWLFAHGGAAATPSTVVSALLSALAITCLAGLRHPVKMMPILVFELVWKLLWVWAYALPAWRNGTVDSYTSETFFACMLGVVLVPLILPWKYLWNSYFRTTGDRWRNPVRTSASVVE